MRRVASILGLFLCLCLAEASSASAASPWVGPTEVGNAGEPELMFGPGPSVAVDDQGDSAVVWEGRIGPRYEVQATTRPAGGSWEPAVELSAPGDIAVFPQIAIDAAGDTTAVWSSRGGTTAVIKAATKPAGGTWGPAVTISDPALESSLAEIAVDPAGEATVILSVEDSTGVFPQAVTRPVGGGWEAPVDLAPPSTHSSTPDVAVDAAGEATAVWEVTDGTETFVQAASRPAGGAWGPHVDLSTGEAEFLLPRIAVNAAGAAVASWSSSSTGNSIQAATRPAGGGWEPAVDLSGPLPFYHSPPVAIDEAGEALVIWEAGGGTGGPIEAVTKPPAGAWSKPNDLAPGELSTDPAVAFARNGEPIAIWVRLGGPGEYIQTSSRPPGQGWTPPIDLPVIGSANTLPALAFDPQGDGIATWFGALPTTGAPHYIVEATGYDGSGPQLRSLSVPKFGVPGTPLDFSVSPLDVWSAVGGVEWSFGDGATGSGTTAVHTYASPGTYQVQIKATDSLGNVTTSSAAVVIETEPGPDPSHDTGHPAPSPPPPAAPPRVTLRYTPNHPHHPDPAGGPRYTFHFFDPTGQGTFSCRLDRSRFRPCTSPTVYRHLARGRHAFQVKATSADGTTSPVRTVHFIAGRRG